VSEMDSVSKHFTQNEVQERLEGIKKADVVRFVRIYESLGCCRRTSLSPYDVLNHVVADALSLNRPWPRDVGLIPYFRVSGRSIISNSEGKGPVLILKENIEDQAIVDNSTSPTGDFVASAAEVPLEKMSSSAFVQEWVDRVFALFENDEDALCYLTGKLKEYKKGQILILCHFSDQVYKNVQKRIGDKAKKEFPKGVPWLEAHQ